MSEPVAIASRTYDLAPDQEVTLVLFAPIPDGGDWACAFEIRWPHKTIRRRLVGVDSVQALVSAIGIAKAFLSASAEGKAGRLTWFGDPGMEFGLPDLPATRARPTDQIGS